MKSHSQHKFPITLVAVCCIGLAAGIVAFRAQADTWDKKTILTTNQPIQVTDTVLEPGKYVFILHDSSSDRHIVQIYNGDQTHIISTILAIPNERLQRTSKSRFQFWETPPGTVTALRGWFYPGDVIGDEFPYPRHPKQLAMLETHETVAQPQAPQPSIAEPPAQETPAAPQPVPQSMTQVPRKEEPVEIAQNSPPASVPAEPQVLPKTASPYPLIGLGGLLSVGLFGALRMKGLSQR
jgi:hypothetical protein